MNTTEPHNPPKWMIKLMRLIVNSDYLEEIEGDMEEIFIDNVEAHGLRRARTVYFRDVLKLIRPSLLRKLKIFQKLILTTMFKNNLKIAFRNILKHKTNSVINLIGLSIGLTIGAIALLYVTEEFSFDDFHKNKDRIYKIVTKADDGGIIETNAWPVAYKFKTEYPEVESVIYTRKAHPSFKVKDQGNKYGHDIHFASEDFFTMFSFPFLEGDPETALTAPNTIVITEAMKNRYFDGEALGKTLTIRDSIKFQVSGVVKNVPSNSQIKFDMLISFATFIDMSDFQYTEGWGNFNVRNYLMLKEGSDAIALGEKVPGMYRDNIGDWMEEMGVNFQVALVPMKEVYLQSGIYNGFGPEGSLQNVKTIALVALFALLLAAINYINLNTARAANRSKEVGVRKVNGSSKWMLIIQFLTESFLLTLLASLLTIVILNYSLPFFNQLMDKEFTLSSYVDWRLIGSLVALIMTISLLSGYYPAWMMARMKPVQALKSRLNKSAGGLKLRKSLIIFQFFISSIMVLATLIVLNQIDFMKNQHLGFEKEQVLILDGVNLPNDVKRKTFRNLLNQIPAVKLASHSNALPAHPGWQGQWAYPGQVTDKPVDTEYLAIDENYVEVLGLELLAGRNFDPEMKSELADGLLINETCVYAMGWESPEDAIGKKIVSPSQSPQGTVIGVLKDYHGLGLQNDIWPKAMDYTSDRYGRYYAIKFDAVNTGKLLSSVEKVWNELYSNYSFEYFFLDEAFERQYKQEDQLASVLTVFAMIILIISGIGLFGLIAFIATSKTKEVGIRKALGATVFQIIYLFAREFVTLIFIGNVLAIPLILYLGTGWLESFAYRTEIDPFIFLYCIGITMVLSLLLISLKTMKTAKMNPVHSLRYE